MKSVFFVPSFMVKRVMLTAFAVAFAVGFSPRANLFADVGGPNAAAAVAVSPTPAAAAPAPVPAAVPAAAPAPATANATVAAQISVGVAPVKITEPVKRAAAVASIGSEVDAFAKVLETRLAAQLAATRKFKVVTRADLDTVLGEQEFAASGNVDASDTNAAKRYKLAGIATVLQVTVTDFQDRVRTLRSVELDQEITRRDIRVLVSASLLDTTTGVIRESLVIPPVTHENLDRRILAVRSNTAAAGDELVAALAVAVAERVSERFSDALFPAKILSRNGGIVLINRGDGTGIAVDSAWSVYAPGAALIDPDTGENLGADEALVGSVVITEVLPKFSRARIVRGDDIAKGQIVRPAAAAVAKGQIAAPARSAPHNPK